MNFTPFSTSGAAGAATHFVTTGAHQFQGQVAKFQQNIGTGNGTTLGQVVGVVGGMGEGMQYVRTLEGGAQLQQATSQIITLPIALPGAKPGDPQQTMQIQVLNPNITLQQGVQQPKYHMQIPIQGFQQGGAVLTVAYAPDGVEGLQLLGNSLPEGVFRNRTGLQVVAALQPQDLQMLQQQQQQQQEANKEQQGQQIQQQILIQNNQMIITQPQDDKKIINNNNNIMSIVKMEHDDTNDEESSELGAESGSEGGSTWQSNANQEIAKYLSKLPQQSQQALPASLQQFLRLNPDCVLKREPEHPVAPAEDEGEEILPDKAVEQVTSEEDLLKPKKKKKYKKKPLKPARPKPGQVVIAQAIDGTPIYCCPECQMAYPEKEQLELHLSVHKIERRFICGICGAGLKRKEHLERHKLGHNPERPYVCSICHKGFKRKEHLNLHTVIHSGEKTEVCQECGKGFYRKDHLRKHARSHQTRRAREETAGIEMATITPTPTAAASATQGMPSIEVKSLVSSANTRHTVMPEITIHVPTSANMQVPVQISVPHHIVSSLSNGQQHITINPGAQQHTINVEELLAQHS